MRHINGPQGFCIPRGAVSPEVAAADAIGSSVSEQLGVKQAKARIMAGGKFANTPCTPGQISDAAMWHYGPKQLNYFELPADVSELNELLAEESPADAPAIYVLELAKGNVTHADGSTSIVVTVLYQRIMYLQIDGGIEQKKESSLTEEPSKMPTT